MRCARKGGNFIWKINFCPEKGGGMDLCFWKKIKKEKRGRRKP